MCKFYDLEIVKKMASERKRKRESFQDEMIPRRVFLISGYRTHGKDFLANNGLESYCVFSREKGAKLELRKGTILKFADHLKNAVLPFIGYTSIHKYEEEKDKPGVLPVNGTVRDYLIGVAKVTREIDPDFFVKMLSTQIEKVENPIITDFRYPNEHACLQKQHQIVTIRVHRACDFQGNPIPIPSEDETSERSLDDFAFDFVVLPKYRLGEHIQSLTELMPEYKNYFMCS